MNQTRELELEIKGIELSREFYIRIGKPVLEELFPEYMEKAAVGLVGEGSECYGFDDILSTDHDYGPGFCVWLDREDYHKAGERMNQIYEALPREYRGIAERLTRVESAGRRGILEIDAFYRKFLGRDRLPENLREWLIIPEHYLAVATNGEVFEDRLGRFSKIRESLLSYYPEDVRLKKIAARAITMAHSGQCNYNRMMQRHDTVSAVLALGEFVKAALSMVYLLNKKYAPYYKWMWRGLEKVERLTPVGELLKEISETGPDRRCWYGEDIQRFRFELNRTDRVVRLIEEISGLIIDEMKRQGISSSTSDYLEEHGYAALHRIQDETIRALPIMAA